MPPNASDRSRTIPVLNASTHSSESPRGDPMDTTPPPSASMGPPLNSSPDMDQTHNSSGAGEGKDQNNTHTGGAAAAAAQGPKVVQTAFIHKLYK